MNLTPDVPLNNMETLSVQMIPEPAANVPSCMRDFPMIYVKGLVTTACLVLTLTLYLIWKVSRSMRGTRPMPQGDTAPEPAGREQGGNSSEAGVGTTLQMSAIASWENLESNTPEPLGKIGDNSPNRSQHTTRSSWQSGKKSRDSRIRSKESAHS